MWSFRQFTRSIRGVVAVVGLGFGVFATGCGRISSPRTVAGTKPGARTEAEPRESAVRTPTDAATAFVRTAESEGVRRLRRGCGDGFCDFPAGEGKTCPVDCGTCDNGYCQENDWSSCPWECTCNNGVCDPDIDPMYCPNDCVGSAATGSATSTKTPSTVRTMQVLHRRRVRPRRRHLQLPPGLHDCGDVFCGPFENPKSVRSTVARAVTASAQPTKIPLVVPWIAAAATTSVPPAKTAGSIAGRAATAAVSAMKTLKVPIDCGRCGIGVRDE